MGSCGPLSPEGRVQEAGARAHGARTIVGQTGRSSQKAIPMSVQLCLKLSLLFMSYKAFDRD